MDLLKKVTFSLVGIACYSALTIGACSADTPILEEELVIPAVALETVIAPAVALGELANVNLAKQFANLENKALDIATEVIDEVAEVTTEELELIAEVDYTDSDITND